MRCKVNWGCRQCPPTLFPLSVCPFWPGPLCIALLFCLQLQLRLALPLPYPAFVVPVCVPVCVCVCVCWNFLNCRGHQEDIDLIERKQLLLITVAGVFFFVICLFVRVLCAFFQLCSCFNFFFIFAIYHLLLALLNCLHLLLIIALVASVSPYPSLSLSFIDQHRRTVPQHGLQQSEGCQGEFWTQTGFTYWLYSMFMGCRL